MLKKIIPLAILGISYIFFLRALGTFYPDWFSKNNLIYQCTELFVFLAYLFVVLFFYFLLRDYILPGQVKLKNATILALTGSIAILVIHLKKVSNILPLKFLTRIYLLESVILWFNSIFITIFFITFYRELDKELTSLREASFLAFLGSVFILLLRSLILINYYLHISGIRWFEGSMQKFAVISLPAMGFNFAALLYFFVAFYKHIEGKGTLT